MGKLRTWLASLVATEQPSGYIRGVRQGGADNCDCLCHTDMRTMHAEPCCRPCPYCHVEFRSGELDDHKKSCPSAPPAPIPGARVVR